MAQIYDLWIIIRRFTVRRLWYNRSFHNCRLLLLDPTIVCLGFGVIVFLFVIFGLVKSDVEGDTDRYSKTRFSHLERNLKQEKVVLVTSNNQLGWMFGEVISTAPNTIYWDQPFQVCWEDPDTCKRDLGTTHPVSLLPQLLSCHGPLLAFLKEEVYYNVELDDLRKRCASSKFHIVRVSTLRMIDLEGIKVEHGLSRMKIVILIEDPRSQLAQIKNNGRFMQPSGRIAEFTEKTMSKAIWQICDLAWRNFEYVGGEGKLSDDFISTYSVRELDLIADLEQEIRGVFHFLGIAWPKSTELAVKGLEFPDQVKDKTVDFDLEAAQSNIEDWKVDLNRNEILSLERNMQCEKLIQEAGFDFHDFELEDNGNIPIAM